MSPRSGTRTGLGARRTGLRAATLSLALALAGAGLPEGAAAQVGAAGSVGSPAAAAPEWVWGWSPLRPLLDLPRDRLPGGAVDMPALLTAPAPRVGLFWTAGNPAGLPLEVREARAEFRAGAAGISGDYARPLDPGSESAVGASALGWRPLGPRGAVIGGFAAGRASFGDSLFADVDRPYGSNPYLVIDTIGDPVDRITARLEGAGGYRLGDLGVGLALGYESGEANTVESPVPKNARSVMPAVTAGISYGDQGLRGGVFCRWQGWTEQITVTTVARPSRIYQLDGYGEPEPLDLQPARYQRRFERDGRAVGAAVAGRTLGVEWTLHGRRKMVDERQTSRLQENEPRLDRWDAEGWSGGAAFQRAFGAARLMLTGRVGYTTLEGEALRADIGEVTFRADEDRFSAVLDGRLRPGSGWLLGGRLHAVRESRRRRDLLAEARSDIVAWEAGAAVGVARSFSGGLALSLEGLFSSYGPSGLAPDPAERGPVYRRFVGPALSLALEEAQRAAGALTFRWRTAEGTAFWLRGEAGSLRPTGGIDRLPLTPTGSRSAWSLTAGAALRPAGPGF